MLHSILMLFISLGTGICVYFYKRQVNIKTGSDKRQDFIVWLHLTMHRANGLLTLMLTRDVMEPANICIRRMRISCAKSVGCGCGLVARSKLPAIIATVIELCYLKLSSCKWTSSGQL